MDSDAEQVRKMLEIMSDEMLISQRQATHMMSQLMDTILDKRGYNVGQCGSCPGIHIDRKDAPAGIPVRHLQSVPEVKL